jgi:hypothetical protein
VVVIPISDADRAKELYGRLESQSFREVSAAAIPHNTGVAMSTNEVSNNEAAG